MSHTTKICSFPSFSILFLVSAVLDAFEPLPLLVQSCNLLPQHWSCPLPPMALHRLPVQPLLARLWESGRTIHRSPGQELKLPAPLRPTQRFLCSSWALLARPRAAAQRGESAARQGRRCPSKHRRVIAEGSLRNSVETWNVNERYRTQ